jgi:hypothetical protein
MTTSDESVGKTKGHGPDERFKWRHSVAINFIAMCCLTQCRFPDNL